MVDVERLRIAKEVLDEIISHDEPAIHQDGFISYKPIVVKKLFCSHPFVKRIWEYGGMSAIPTDGLIYRNICILFNDETRMNFSDVGDGKAIEDAEKYLKSLPK